MSLGNGIMISQILAGSLILTLSLAGQAEAPSFDVMCRQKAKEIAAETYRGCVTENKKVQIEQLKNDYQSKLQALKSEYDNEIKRLSGANQKSQAPAVTPKKTARSGSSPSAARSFPSKTRKAVPAAGDGSDEMSVQLHPVQRDDSSMDIPEPIPVESLPDNESQI